MIFDLLYLLTMAGFSACDVLMGVYMIRYAGASELDLGLIFMILPLAVITRPYLCTIADRYQTHKKLLAISLLVNAIMYVPFVILPFIQQENQLITIFTPRVCFWLLAVCHLIGSVSFCGTRSLGDALAVNYAKRIGSDFTSYRKYGAISYGICGFFLGKINKGWILPDFTPTFIVHVTCLSILSLLVHLWPNEFFVIKSGHHDAVDEDEPPGQIPNGKQVLVEMGKKLKRTILCCESDPMETQKPSKTVDTITINNKSKTTNTGNELVNPSGQVAIKSNEIKKPLTTRQQLGIFLLLMRRDFRIPLFLLLLAFGGIVGYAPRGFVFTYMDIFCHENKTCDGSSLAGLVMITYCVVETICYLGINAFRSRLNNTVLLQASLVSLAVHYFCYGFFLVNGASPYFFLIESMHGIEYAFSLATSVDLAHYFATEVVLIMPELMQRGIIDERNDQKLVKVSLMATMNSCFTLAYDGGGSLIGAFLCGLLVENLSFTLTFILIGALSTVGFFSVLFAILIGKCLHLRPQVVKLRGIDYQAKESN